ncbi:MAG: ABC transporter substrate-binding protein [bacterium]
MGTTFFRKLIIAVAVGIVGLTASSGVRAAAESTDPILFAMNDWSSQLINSRIMGAVLEQAGYNVEYVQADAAAQFVGLKRGDLHVQMEVWSTTQAHLLEEGVASGKIDDLGETGMAAIEEWWYPSYMVDQCPGLPDWKALKACAEAFSIPETAPKGRYVGGPVNWGGYDDERVEALDLGFEVIHAGSDAAMFAELASAYERKAPVILWVWAPHWVPAKFDGAWIDFPAYADACYEDASWGVNPDMLYDCAKPRGPIWKTAWSGLKDKWPGAYRALKNFKTDNEEQAALIGQVELEGRSIEDVVAEWMSNNEVRWKSWIDN